MGALLCAVACGPAHSRAPARVPTAAPSGKVQANDVQAPADRCDGQRDPLVPVRRVLDNGLEVEVWQMREARASVRLELPVGRLDGPPHLAHLVEHVVADWIGRGAGVLSISAMGAGSSAQTGPRTTSFSVGGSPHDLLRFVWLLRRGLALPVISEEDVRTAVAVVRKEEEEKARMLGYPGRIAWEAALRGQRNGTVDPLAIPAYTPDDIVAFSTERYRIDGAKLVVRSPYPPARIAPHVVALWEDAPPGRPKPRPNAHDEPPRGVARICVAGLERASFVYAVPDVVPSFDEDLVTILTEVFQTQTKDAAERIDGGGGLVDRVGVQRQRGVPLQEGWTFMAYAGSDLPWDTLERVGRALIPSIWKIDPEALVHAAAARWYAAAVRTTCGPPPPRPDPSAFVPEELPAPPPPRLLVLVRGEAACSQR